MLLKLFFENTAFNQERLSLLSTTTTSSSASPRTDTLTQLLDQLRDKVRVKMARKGRKYKRDVKEDKGEGAKLISLHSGVLGLCAFVEAFPHDVPSFLPPILMELSTHLNDRQVCSFRKL